MREIKFKTWNKEKKEMSKPFNIIGFEYDGYYLENSIFLEFIGLKDSEGKEVCDGDIIQVRKDSMWVNPKPDVVEWDDDMAGFSPFIMKGDESYSGEWDAENFKIIGNIYENPELIKNKEVKKCFGKRIK